MTLDLSWRHAPPAAPARTATILQVLPSLVTGGVERGAVDVAVALARAGATALVASAGGPMSHEIERHGGRHITAPLDRKRPWTMRANARLLARLIEREQVDIVHARSRAPAWSAYWAAQRAGRPFVTTFHGAYNIESQLKRRYNSVMAKGDRVIAISNFIAQHIIENYEIEPRRICVIPRGVDMAAFDPAAVRPSRIVDLAEAWRVDDGAPVVTLPGRLTRWKGQPVLIEAIARLARRDLHVILVGSEQDRTRYRDELGAQIDRAGLGGVVRMVGECRDMPAAYMLSDVVVSASTDPEAFGRVAAEASAMGRPVIATDHGGARETVRQGETGWLAPPGDAAALANAIAAMLALSEAERLALGRRARDFVRPRFSRETMCQATLALYQEVLDRRPAARTF